MIKVFLIFNFFIILFLGKNVLSLDNQYKLKILKSNLSSPWSISFVNKNEILISEKTGKIKLFNLTNSNINEINHNLNFVEDGNSQGELLEILYHNDEIYISYSENRGESKLYGPTSTSIAKAKFNRKNLNFKNIFRADPPIRSPYHFGSRIVIKDNHLYA